MRKILELMFDEGFYFASSDDGVFSEQNMKHTILHRLHPQQIIANIELYYVIYRIRYQYTTVRGNKKQGEKIFFFEGLNPEINIRHELDLYIQRFNSENKHRPLSNVKFLDGECLGYIKYPV